MTPVPPQPERAGGAPAPLAIVPLSVRVHAGTHVGMQRAGNEDHHGVWCADDAARRRRLGTLLVVADGMGGSRSGEVASALAVETVIRVVSAADGADPAGTLRHALLEANRAVHAAGIADPARSGMGTTCTAVLIRDDAAWIGHVGDSRAYLVRAGGIRQLTEDHTLVAQLVKMRELTRQQARRDPRRSILTQSIGTHPEVEPEVTRADERLQPGDAILLCSDGLHGYFNDSELADMVAELDPASVVEALIAEANDRGGGDNITAVVAYLGPPAGGSERGLPAVREA